MPSQKSSLGSKLLLSFSFIFVSTMYVVWQNLNGTQSVTTTTPPPHQQPMMTKPMMHSGLYADGSYTGSPADAYYGTIQVKVVVTRNRIADVQFLQYPNDRSTSRYISGQAMPMLTQEAIQAQNANVDGVSGATATSGAFIESLTSALALAKN